MTATICFPPGPFDCNDEPWPSAYVGDFLPDYSNSIYILATIMIFIMSFMFSNLVHEVVKTLLTVLAYSSFALELSDTIQVDRVFVSVLGL
jgi:hypothetical protein